jgi:hypothetical protein
MAKDKDISGLIAEAFKPRSTLAAWMREHHDAFHERISTQVPDWPALVAAFAKEGLTNRFGRPPQAEAARKMWRQIHRDVMASRTDEKPTTSAPVESTQPKRVVQPPPARPVPPVPVAPAQGFTHPPPDDDDDPEKFFRTITKI